MLRLRLHSCCHPFFTKAEHYFMTHLLELPYLPLLKQLKQPPPFRISAPVYRQMMLRLAARHCSRDVLAVMGDEHEGGQGQHEGIVREGLRQIMDPVDSKREGHSGQHLGQRAIRHLQRIRRELSSETLLSTLHLGLPCALPTLGVPLPVLQSLRLAYSHCTQSFLQMLFSQAGNLAPLNPLALLFPPQLFNISHQPLLHHTYTQYMATRLQAGSLEEMGANLQWLVRFGFTNVHYVAKCVGKMETMVGKGVTDLEGLRLVNCVYMGVRVLGRRDTPVLRGLMLRCGQLLNRLGLGRGTADGDWLASVRERVLAQLQDREQSIGRETELMFEHHRLGHKNRPSKVNVHYQTDALLCRYLIVSLLLNLHFNLPLSDDTPHLSLPSLKQCLDSSTMELVLGRVLPLGQMAADFLHLQQLHASLHSSPLLSNPSLVSLLAQQQQQLDTAIGQVQTLDPSPQPALHFSRAHSLSYLLTGHSRLPISPHSPLHCLYNDPDFLAMHTGLHLKTATAVQLEKMLEVQYGVPRGVQYPAMGAFWLGQTRDPAYLVGRMARHWRRLKGRVLEAGARGGVAAATREILDSNKQADTKRQH